VPGRALGDDWIVGSGIGATGKVSLYEEQLIACLDYPAAFRRKLKLDVVDPVSAWAPDQGILESPFQSPVSGRNESWRHDESQYNRENLFCHSFCLSLRPAIAVRLRSIIYLNGRKQNTSRLESVL
jgi:hypothetical protein